MPESLEGKRGTVRTKPPIPAIEGLFGKPTVVNNVLTLATVPVVLADGAKAYQELGVERSRGTQVFQLGGNIAHDGIIETAFGVTLRELVEDYGGGTFSGRPVRTVQVGGPLGVSADLDVRPSRRPGRWSGTAASCCSTTALTWPPRRASRWSSALRSPAASAHRAESVRCVVSR
jgi:hypothetical protein